MEGFLEGAWYAVDTRGLPMMRVLRLDDDRMTVSIDGKEVEATRFFWKDGTESAYARLEDGSTLVSYSTKTVQEPSIDSDKLDKQAD